MQIAINQNEAKNPVAELAQALRNKRADKQALKERQKAQFLAEFRKAIEDVKADKAGIKRARDARELLSEL